MPNSDMLEREQIDAAVATATKIKSLAPGEALALASRWMMSRRLSEAVRKLNALERQSPHRGLASQALAKLGFGVKLSYPL